MTKQRLMVVLSATMLIVACSGSPSDSTTNNNIAENKIGVKTTGQKAEINTAKILVRFKADANRTAIHKTLGSSVERQFSSVAGLELVVLPAGVSLQEALDYYNQHPDVRYAEAEQQYETQ